MTVLGRIFHVEVEHFNDRKMEGAEDAETTAC